MFEPSACDPPGLVLKRIRRRLAADLHERDRLHLRRLKSRARLLIRQGMTPDEAVRRVMAEGWASVQRVPTGRGGAQGETGDVFDPG